ncbi:pectate lyase [Prevotella sp. PTAC]|uniref:pectate lyase n=1 Tax=Prevotella sp. PTAC TaxID=2736295 RepID=UPI00352EA2B0
MRIDKSIIMGVMSLMLTTAAMPAGAADTKEKLPAFPGAEGFGRYTTGGRGGTVYHVTTLEDTGQEGSFRWACGRSGKRTIVFDVSGTIYLKSQLKLNRGDVTIAGQTAPGDGICIADYPFQISADNVIIRYLRFRVGNRHVDQHEGDGLGGMDKKNIIVDHCSVSWSVDECLSLYGCHNTTVQWCIASHSMVNSGHSKGAHGYGGNWGGSGASYHHNLMIHHTSRTPRLGPRPGTQTDERMDMRNNVIYNWAGEGCYGGEGMNVNIVKNYYKPGPGTESRNTTIQRRIANIGIRTSSYTKHDTDNPNEWDIMWRVWGKFFVDGNVNPKYSDVTKDNWTYGIYNQITNSKVDNTFTPVTKDTMRINTPIDFVAVTTHTAEDAYSRVLDYAGCSKSRDSYDNTLAADARNGKATYTGSGLGKGFVNSQDDCGGWPVLNGTEAPKDSDGDGIPDEWETANGLNPNDKTDGAKTADNGYTNLENYLNSLVADITEAQNAGGTIMGYVINEDGSLSTGIDSVIKNVDTVYDNRVYTLDGRMAGTDIETLPKGIYIINKRKVVIK